MPAPSLRDRAFVPVLVYTGLVVAVISSLGAPLVPTLAKSLHVSITDAQWSLTATLVTAAVTTPFIGRLGDGPKRRQVIIGCLAIVVVGGVLAATATSLGVLIVGRAMQGVGIALVPLTMASARDGLPKDRWPPVIALLSVSGAAGVGLGYPLTGLLASQFGPSGAFWFGTIVSAIGLVLCVLVVPDATTSGANETVDVGGAVLIGVALVALLIGLEKGPDWGWAAPRTLGPIAAGIVLSGLWAGHELRTKDPLVDLRLVRHRAVASANAAAFLIGVTMYMALVLISQFVQERNPGLGESVFLGGLTFVPFSLLSLGCSRTLPAVQRRAGVRAVVPLGSLSIGLGLVFFAATTSALWQIFVTMGLIGIGVGYTFAAMPGLIAGSIPASETGSAMGFYQVSRYVGFALGSGLSVTFLRVFDHGGAPSVSTYRDVAFVTGAVAASAAATAWVLTGRGSGATSDPLEALEEGALASASLERV